jgi:hypothetical protein
MNNSLAGLFLAGPPPEREGEPEFRAAMCEIETGILFNTTLYTIFPKGHCPWLLFEYPTYPSPSLIHFQRVVSTDLA